MGRRALLRNDSPLPVAPVWRESGESGHIPSDLVTHCRWRQPETRPHESGSRRSSRQRIMLLDGSMGALIYSHELSEEQFRGKRFASHPLDLKNCTEALVLTQPKIIEDIHRAYLEAGADIIETDTFNGIGAVAGGVRPAGPRLRAQQDRGRAGPPRRRRIHAHAIPASPGSSPAASGRPTSSSRWASTSRTRAAATSTFDQMVANYTEQVRGLVAGGVDILLPETAFDTLVLKACLFAIDEFFEKTGTRLPVMISGTIFDDGRTLSAPADRGVLLFRIAFRRPVRRPQLRRRRRADARLDRDGSRRSAARG